MLGSSPRSHVGSEDVVGVAVEILAGAVVPHGRAWVGVARGDLDVAEVDACIKHRGDEGMAQHVRVHAWQRHSGVCFVVTTTPETAGPEGEFSIRPLLSVGGPTVKSRRWSARESGHSGLGPQC